MKPFSLFLAEINEGQTNAALTAHIAELFQAVKTHGRAGTLKLAIKVVPAGTKLYAAPPAAPAVPLTDEQINEVASALFYVDEPAGSTVMRFRLQWLESIARPLARAIEKAHGIGGGNG